MLVCIHVALYAGPRKLLLRSIVSALLFQIRDERCLLKFTGEHGVAFLALGRGCGHDSFQRNHAPRKEELVFVTLVIVQHVSLHPYEKTLGDDLIIQQVPEAARVLLVLGVLPTVITVSDRPVKDVVRCQEVSADKTKMQAVIAMSGLTANSG